jgi:shikimate kinase
MHASAHIVLVGPMGAGKTTLGRALAARLGCAFVDVDARIEADAAQSIPALFAAEGEAGFRRRESDALRAVLAGAPAVVATGGGAVLDAGNRAAMRAAGTVVYLTLDPATQLARLGGDTGRPLLQTADPAGTLAALQAQREPLYREAAHLAFDAGALAPDAAAIALADRLAALETCPA